MPINLKANANFDLHVDGKDAMNIYMSLAKPNGLMNMIEHVVITANSNNNLDVSFDSSNITGVHVPTTDGDVTITHSEPNQEPNMVENLTGSADSADSSVDPNDYDNNARKGYMGGVNTIANSLGLHGKGGVGFRL